MVTASTVALVRQMARKLRLLFPNALYHVINRGNYRRDVFETSGSKGAFLAALDEACLRHRWRVHAYVVMRNHFHLALETPEPNLTAGMHWLLGTFANRFNRFRDERGHLFQGRYQAQLLEDQTALGRVVDYIHLNPVRAGLVTPEAVGTFPESSLKTLRQQGCPVWLTAEGIRQRMGAGDVGPVWARYEAHLAEVAGSPEAQARLGFPTLTRGCAIGTRGWLRALAKDHAQFALNPGFEAGEVRELREASWQRALAEVLKEVGIDPRELEAGAVKLDRKVEIAVQLRTRGGVPYAWIARMLKVSHAPSLRMQVHRRMLQVSA